MMRKPISFILTIILLIIGSGCAGQETNLENANAEYAISFTDDMGEEIKLEKPCVRIISLYSAHTENLFSLGLADKVIGVGISDIYPVQVLEKSVYDYKSDPEKVIAAEPDLVLIRPFINRKSPEFVEAIKRVGIPVVSLYPGKLGDFDNYILKLGMLTGKEDAAREKLEMFYSSIDEITEITKDIEPKEHLYFESTENKYRTVTQDSMASNAIKFAGGINVADDVEPITEGSSIASYGIEHILQKADEIDVYVSQRGAMNSGGSYHSIVIRPGFDTIRAVQNDRVFTINQKIISSPTFRYYKGVREMARFMYPETMDTLDELYVDSNITRENMAEIIVKFTHKPIFVPSSSKYYKKTYAGHTYGFFSDMEYTDECYDYVETAVISGYMDEYKVDGEEYFYPDSHVTKDELAKIVFLAGDFSRRELHKEIIDLEEAENKKIIQILVDNEVFEFEDGYFKPDEEVTGRYAIDILNKAKQVSE